MYYVVPTNDETWLICGGRDFCDQEMFDSAMTDLLGCFGCPAVVVHGAARGADKMADAWGKKMAAQVIPVEAHWDGIDHPDALVRTRKDGTKYDARAGIRRNQKMLDRYRPHKVIAFPGGNGTGDMIRRARKTRADVVEIKPA